MSLPTDIMLRPARLQDIPEIARISAGIWDGEDYVPRVAAGWISDPSGRFVAAEHEGIVRGFGRIVMHTATDAWAEGLRDSCFTQGSLGASSKWPIEGAALKPGAVRTRHSLMRFSSWMPQLNLNLTMETTSYPCSKESRHHVGPCYLPRLVQCLEQA